MAGCLHVDLLRVVELTKPIWLQNVEHSSQSQASLIVVLSTDQCQVVRYLEIVGNVLCQVEYFLRGSLAMTSDLDQ